MDHRPATAPPGLRPHRVHDVVGFSAMTFAAMRAAQSKGPIIWIEGGAGRERLYPPGFAPLFNPERLIFVTASKPKEELWCMEEALRETPAFVIASLPETTGLLESRRLQLAAEAGGSTGICLVPDTAVNNAAETRWRSTPLPCAKDSTLHHWELIKNKKGILGTWDICWNAKTHSLSVVAASGGGARDSERWDNRLNAPVRSGRDAQKRLAALLDQRGG